MKEKYIIETGYIKWNPPNYKDCEYISYGRHREFTDFEQALKVYCRMEPDENEYIELQIIRSILNDEIVNCTCFDVKTDLVNPYRESEVTQCNQ